MALAKAMAMLQLLQCCDSNGNDKGNVNVVNATKKSAHSNGNGNTSVIMAMVMAMLYWLLQCGNAHCKYHIVLAVAIPIAITTL